jgi:hypothetical protein
VTFYAEPRAASRGDAPTSETTAPTGERAAIGSQFPHGMRNAATAYASFTSTDVAVYEDLPGHHLLAVRNLVATTNDESYHGSASELPPTTSHGYAEWDFSGVPDPVMFQWFLDAADYWFGYSDDSSTRSYDPARECFMVAIGDLTDGANVAGAGDGEAPQNPGTSAPRNPGQVCLPPRRRGPRTSTRNWLKRASSRLSSRRNTERCDYYASIDGEASARGECVS